MRDLIHLELLDRVTELVFREQPTPDHPAVQAYNQLMRRLMANPPQVRKTG